MRARKGFPPPEQIIAEMAIPVTMEPSTVRSGILRVLNERKTPNARTAYIIPSSSDPRKAANVIIIVFILLKFFYSPRTCALSRTACGNSTPIASAVLLLMYTLISLIFFTGMFVGASPPRT